MNHYVTFDLRAMLGAHLKIFAFPLAAVGRPVLLTFGLGRTRPLGAHLTLQLAHLVVLAALRVAHVGAVVLFVPTTLGVHAALLRH